MNISQKGHNTTNISDEGAIWTTEHDIQSPEFVMTKGSVVIGARVWFCFRSIVLPGTTLGEGRVLAPEAVVTRSSLCCGCRSSSKGSKELTCQLGNPKVARWTHS
jgi:acetyltransferase-like isoleucine patch superfamily enzyme